MALDIVYSDDTTMLGLEMEGNLGESGVEVRGEIAYIKSALKTHRFKMKMLNLLR